jgi:hypothetical protein
MLLDIRLPIGLLFTIFGIILTIYGIFSDKQIHDIHSLGININLWWGLLILIFGLIFLFSVRKKLNILKETKDKK